jgi:transposase
VPGIDEHFFSRKQGYATTLVDLKNHKVFDVVPGRSKASLHSYLKRLPGKEQVRVIVMNLSETYRQIARQYFLNAMISPIASTSFGWSTSTSSSCGRAMIPRVVRTGAY